MRAVVACLLLVALTLAGCTAKDKDKDAEIVADDTSATGSTSASSTTGSPGAATPTGTSSVSSSTSTAPAPEDNSAPTGTISAVINGTKVAFSLNGTDADGDALNWTLNFGDNSTDAAGASLPALVNHTYAVGNYSAVFGLNDGVEVTSYNVSLSVKTVVAAPVGPTTQTAAAEWSFGSCSAYQADMMAEKALAGVGYGLIDIAPGTIGKPYVVEYTGADFWLSWGIVFFNASNAEVAGGASTVLEAYSFAGTVPAGATQAVFYSCPGAMDAVTYTAG